uniref:DUF220 domain-containing protein n=1 Tax=Setaria italica TaxID=4555 RepID=K3ZVE0_SETIT
MGDGSRQEPAVSRLSDGLPQKPALGFNSFLQIPDKIQNSLKVGFFLKKIEVFGTRCADVNWLGLAIVHFGRFLKKDGAGRGMNAQMSPEMGKESCTAAAQFSLDRQLQAWRNNPSWTDEPPEIKVTVPEGSLCNLNLRFKAGLPPDAVYNIIIDPENKRVFKNIKVKFKQGRTGFMRKFEGCWRIEPIFVDKEVCLPLHPCTLEEYESCTGGRGRVASAITLDQLIEPALLPPPPISWYLRGITSRTTEMLVNDLIAETARLRGISNNADGKQDVEEICDASKSHPVIECGDIKERWRQRRKSGRHGNSLRLTSQFL